MDIRPGQAGRPMVNPDPDKARQPNIEILIFQLVNYIIDFLDDTRNLECKKTTFIHNLIKTAREDTTIVFKSIGRVTN